MRKLNTKEFIEKAKTIHEDKYDYSLVEYHNARGKIKIICKVHGEFEQAAYSHLDGIGCWRCAKEKSQFDKYKNKETTLYYVKINDFFKIGLAQNSVEARFNKEIKAGLNIQIIKEIKFKDGYDALLLEQKILYETRHLQIDKNESPISGGWTEIRKECFLQFLINI